MKPYYSRDGITIYCADAFDVTASLPDNSVDLIATDPPYHRVKNEAWDRQWKTDAEFIAWIGRNCEAWQRILKPNGSLYCFASPQMSARVECEIARRFEVLNRITWRKPPFATKAEMFVKEDLRCFFPASESIIFAEHFSADNMAKGEAGYVAKCDELRGFVFEPLRAYLDGERARAGVDKIAVNVACGFSATPGGMAARHYFSRSQWWLPTAEHYAKLQSLFNANGGEFLRREYEDLRREYEDLRRPFSVTADVPYTDVWDFPTVNRYPGKHPCEKPLAMMEHIVRSSTRDGAVVFDPFMGSGTTLLAARNLGRQAIGCDLDERWCAAAVKRLSQSALNLKAAA